MDWTGGTRRRYARISKSNEVLAKQKAHFARSRAAGTTRLSDSMPEFMREAVVCKGYRPPSTSHLGQDYVRGKYVGGSRDSTSAAHQQHESDASRQYAGLSRHTETRVREGPNDNTISRGSERSRSRALPANNTDGDPELHATRHLLLARSDWLGLSACRPLKIKFPANRSSDRVGQRRKIERRHPDDAHSTLHRRITPPFRHRERLLEPMMSGALLEHGIDIKIGTDAFASQTQRSRNTLNLANTSMRQPSTEFGPLSEESMLLGEEGGDVLAGAGGPDFGHHAGIFSPTAEVNEQLSVYRAESPIDHDNYAVTTLQTEQWPSMQTIGQPSQDLTYPHVSVAPAMSLKNLGRDEGQEQFRSQEILNLAGYLSDGQSPDSSHSNQSPLTTESQLAVDLHFDVAAQPFAHDHVADYKEEWWQSLSKVPRCASRVPLKRTSLNTTQSTLNSQALAVRDTSLPSCQACSSPEQPDLQVDGVFSPVPDDTGGQAFEVTSAAVLTQRTDKPVFHVNRPSAMAGSTTDHDDELWRQFVVCSNGSDSGSSLFGGKIWEVAKEQRISAPVPVSDAASDQLRSDRVTTGGSTMAAPALTEPSKASSLDHATENTSLVGHPATIRPDADETEDSYVPKRKARAKSTMHASQHVLNPKRFRRRQLSHHSPLPKPSRFLPPLSVRAIAHKRSVYDIALTSE